jgi:hypothetical protein
LVEGPDVEEPCVGPVADDFLTRTAGVFDEQVPDDPRIVLPEIGQVDAEHVLARHQFIQVGRREVVGRRGEPTGVGPATPCVGDATGELGSIDVKSGTVVIHKVQCRRGGSTLSHYRGRVNATDHRQQYDHANTY